MRRILAILYAGTILFSSWPVSAQTELDRSSLSRQMRTAIRFYERGEDLHAMDRFMEILTKGDPGERSMANEYINLITQRMNAAGGVAGSQPSAQEGFIKSAPVREQMTEERGSRRSEDEDDLTIADERPAPRASPARPAAERAAPQSPLRRGAPEIVVEDVDDELMARGPAGRAVPAPASAPEPAARPSRRRAEAPLPRANKELMKKEIKAKIRAGLDRSLKELRQYEDIRVIMQANGDPLAIGIPSPLLFSNGIAFKKEARKILDSLTRMVYSLGSTKVYIMPEGAAIGDAKVLDMRRTMGISAHMFQAGIAPPRVKVNLLSQQVEMPKSIQDFKGVVLVFVYNEPLGLVVESALGDESGPPLSLGVYPPNFRPDKDEGVIIELSVSDPPSGLMSWKFQLLRPSATGDLEPLQEIRGGGPVFHQVYWNGRQGYFGPVLPAGRYECVLTGTDTKNRSRTLHRWIQIPESASSAPAVEAESAAAPARPMRGVEVEAAPAKPAGAPSADLEPAAGSAALIKAPPKKAAVQVSRPRQANARKRAVAPEPKAEAPRKPASGHFDVDFNKGTHQLTPEGERRLSSVAETAAYYPLERLKLVAYAHSLEPDPASLAERRAKMVAGLLINKYQVEPKKIEFSSKVVEEPLNRVEVYFAGNQ